MSDLMVFVELRPLRQLWASMGFVMVKISVEFRWLLMLLEKCLRIYGIDQLDDLLLRNYISNYLFLRLISAISVMRIMQATTTPRPTAASVISGWASPSIDTIGTVKDRIIKSVKYENLLLIISFSRLRFALFG